MVGVSQKRMVLLKVSSSFIRTTKTLVQHVSDNVFSFFLFLLLSWRAGRAIDENTRGETDTKNEGVGGRSGALKDALNAEPLNDAVGRVIPTASAGNCSLLWEILGL